MLGHVRCIANFRTIFRKESASYIPGNMVFCCILIICITILLQTQDAHFYHLKLGVHHKFSELFTTLQAVHGVAWKEPNINTFGVSHKATSSPPPPILNL